MKFSFRQILASAGGAVMAAVIASLFGVKGTIVGVAIGSAAATFGTAVVSQSIERGHQAVKQVVVRVPDRTSLLRRMGNTEASGQTESAPTESMLPADPTVISAAVGDETTQASTAGDDTTVVPAVVTDLAATELVPVVRDDDPITAEMRPPVRPRRSIPWRAISGTAAVVFALSLLLVTAVELLAGHPLADLFSHTKSNDPSIANIFTPTPAPATTTTTTSTSTTTTTVPATTTSTSTTTTTAPGTSSTTSTTSSGSSTTTTTGLLGQGTTTTTGG